MIDSHCHLDYPPLYENLDKVIDRAKNEGIKYLLTISTTLNSFEKIKTIVSKYSNIYGTLGIHPHETKDFSNLKKDELIKIKDNNKKIIAIGETGLDYYYKNTNPSLQKKLFVEHIKSAIDLNIPVIVHSRSAEKDTFDILNQYSKEGLKILMHCFTGSQDFSKKLIDIGAYISLSGIITFKNSIELQKTVSALPINRILIETDSPFLAPTPNRGKSNEPSFMKYTAEKLAEIKKISFEDIKKNTTENFNRLFSLKL